MAAPERRTVSSPTPDDDRSAAAAGLTEIRDIHQLRRPLPVDVTAPVETRAFVPGSSDEDEWITLNNRAFSSHPDQSAMTTDRLHAQMAEDWFDPDGFRLCELDSRLAAFCWTKRHPATATNPALGEIYVIGVDPDCQGQGLGRALVVAGLDWLSVAGETIGMLYVDAVNTPARELYAALGFELHHIDRLYEKPTG